MTEKNDYYYPSGIPVSPQARRFGYEFPVHVSKHVWSAQCLWAGSPSKQNTNTERRIVELLQHCYEGMTKKLAVQDDFTSYQFKTWYWCPVDRNRKKKRRVRLGARLFLDPNKGGPWLYIFNPEEDSFDELKQGLAPPVDGKVLDTSATTSGKDSGRVVHLFGKDGAVLDGSPEDCVGANPEECPDGRD